MQGTSVLFGQVLAVFGVVIAGTWGATQWTAAQLGYQLRLGSPWFDCFGIPIYHPWLTERRAHAVVWVGRGGHLAAHRA